MTGDGRKRTLAVASVDPLELAELARDVDPLVVYRVAQNRSASQETLAALVHSEDKWVLYALGSNPSASPETLSALAKHVDTYVVDRVMQNESTSAETLAQLTRHEKKDVARMAQAIVDRNSRRAENSDDGLASVKAEAV